MLKTMHRGCKEALFLGFIAELKKAGCRPDVEELPLHSLHPFSMAAAAVPKRKFCLWTARSLQNGFRPDRGDFELFFLCFCNCPLCSSGCRAAACRKLPRTRTLSGSVLCASESITGCLEFRRACSTMHFACKTILMVVYVLHVCFCCSLNFLVCHNKPKIFFFMF